MKTILREVTLDQTVRLLASADEDILGYQADRELYGPMALALIEFVAVLSAPQAGALTSFFRVIRIYLNAKTSLQKRSGSLLAKALASSGGGGICEKVEYCENKAKLKDLFDFADSAEGKAVLAKGTDAAMESAYAETIEKLREMLGQASDAIAEATKEVVEQVADIAVAGVPVSFVFMTVKYGLDDLCKCCDVCDSTGSVGADTCPKCNGRGHLRG